MRRFLVVLTVAGIAAGSLAWVAGWPLAADRLWALTTAAALVPLAFSVARDLAHRKLGVDVIALLAMGGSLALAQYLAGAIIALMLSGGLALEAFAAERARRELSALVSRAPRTARRYEDGALILRPLAAVAAGDRLLVGPGEVVPVDGRAVGGTAVLDESALTGESRPAERLAGDAVMSGTVNAGGPFDLEATATAETSTYAGIVRLAQEAQRSRAPFVRLADRYALLFLPLTIAAAGLAWWLGGDPQRALAVLVVATPCPLILAAPVAMVAGLSRCAARGVLVKSGAALEALAGAQVLLLDKTGTLTTGVPALTGVHPVSGLAPDELLGLAAALDQVSPHVFAAALVAAAQARGLVLGLPTDVDERLGAGIRGRVAGREVALGKLGFVAPTGTATAAVGALREGAARSGDSIVWVAVDGVLAGALVLHDPLRTDGLAAVTALRERGVRRVVLLSGDRTEAVAAVGAAVSADLVLAERSPAQKVQTVRDERRHGRTLMVGDGVNDAPALAAADVGVALGARGATASSQAADVVITVDRLDRLAEAMGIARRARTIAAQSVGAGMALSVLAMIAAAAGRLTPVAGALLQEAIDVAVILNALRALRG